MNDIAHGDIIQITKAGHAWFGCVLVVLEVRTWGVVAYISVPQSNDGNISVESAFTRMAFTDFEKVGKAILAHKID